MSETAWIEDRTRGRASEFHAREMPTDDRMAVWWFDVAEPAIVLGSAQPADHIDRVECDRRGIEVVRRRSGGGAVLLLPGEVVWVDVFIPTTHEHWTPDVTSSAWWIGEVWRETAVELGVADPHVHHEAMLSTPWSRHVCFAGLGGGEVTVPGDPIAKLVGISQRRTRHGARFQCALHRRWRADAHVPLFTSPGPTVDDLAGAAAELDVDDDQLRDVFGAALHRALTPRP